MILSAIITALEHWLDSMRQPGGFGGPVVHWWRDCLDYTGPGLDWRYEGIIAGYLNLWERTGEDMWLAKARRAGDDLVSGQLPSGNYRNSQFELNPGSGGTPHEAACDLALLKLASALRNSGNSIPDWEIYYHTARQNIEAFYIQRLWDESAQFFRDDPAVPSFVPNKVATLAEALFALARLSGEPVWAERYALPALHTVLAHQVTGGELDGAIYQNSVGQFKVAKFFPFYIARCLPGLLDGFRWNGDARFADAVRKAAGFILSTRLADGSFPQVLYPGWRVNRYPKWIAAVGDILRTLDLAEQVGVHYDPSPSMSWLLAGQRPDGAFRTAVGFGKVMPGGKTYDPRDDLPVVGWNDKAFRYLTGIARSDSAA